MLDYENIRMQAATVQRSQKAFDAIVSIAHNIPTGSSLYLVRQDIPLDTVISLDGAYDEVAALVEKLYELRRFELQADIAEYTTLMQDSAVQKD